MEIPPFQWYNKEKNEVLSLNCPKCNQRIDDRVKFCPECGYHFVSKKSSDESSNATFIKCLITILAIGAFGIWLISGDSSTSESSSTPKQSVSQETQSTEFSFPPEQISFLNSIGLPSVGIATKSGNQCEFYNDGEKIVVTLNDGGGIVSVTASGDILWDASSGKIGMTKVERKAFLDSFINNSSQKYDQALQVTFIDAVDGNEFMHKGLYLYMVIEGREKTDNKLLFARIHYSDADWVFFKKVIFSNSNESWSYDVDYYDITRKIVKGGIHERIVVPLHKIEDGLKILATGNNPRIDFVGDDRRDGVDVSATEVAEIKKYLTLSKALKD